ncbi:MAG: acyl-CoA synthetase [Alphaproteobacteria bacterium]|jgi:fatty-acyl-CoA synthase|nr:acyl-CoA synthetase [Rhodospirillaceae bacterium]MBT6511226.1 acyl-CoA synthetase [Rhodospirillaceae bacterium]MBT7614542.1 acyl-CoA synthetase [Rhodospirillaceae bacterium]MBT7648551.1 acyl-CoA synthetase [Rhodospirillaceae bacterium]MDG2481780.1 acyl-CoA synthetase [Alphaproteobacteria bacterium]
MTNIYEKGLGQNDANYAPLSPVAFLNRTAAVYPDRTAVIHGPLKRTWRETAQRCRRLASALVARGIAKGDTVALMAPNVPEFLEASLGVPMTNGVLNSLNIRLDAEAIAFILKHGEAKILITDRAFADVVDDALSMLDERPLVIDIDDPQADGAGRLIGDMTYEAFLEEGDPQANFSGPDDEWQAIALNYTSGTTGDPKGVVYHHRGAYMNGMGNIITWAMPHFPVYLWTLPMFHCNGWCFPWTITAMAGTHVCLRGLTAEAILSAIAEHEVSHLCGAPIVMNMMMAGDDSLWGAIKHPVKMMTAGAAPPAAVLERMEARGIEVTHVYGLTEVYGPATVCAWHPEWSDLPAEEQSAVKARQGVTYVVQEGLMVADPETMVPVPSDGETMGEIMMRGNITMLGYLKNEETTRKAFEGGWFHSGDLAVMHPDGYIQIKDRSKDIIISGGENISTIEIEGVLYRHPAVVEAAVVAKPDEKWGETPCAFVTLRPGAEATDKEIIAFCRENLAGFKCPRYVVFTDLPKTSTGKIQKSVLREQAAAV